MNKKHNQMENLVRLTVINLIAVVVLIVGTISIDKKDEQTTNLNQVLYTQETAFTRSLTPVSVMDIFISNNDTEALILFAIDDMEKVSTNVDNYEILVYGNELIGGDVEIYGDLDAHLYMYAGTNNMAIHLTNFDVGFKHQILTFIVRSNLQLGDTAEDIDESHVLNKYEQFIFNVNLGGLASKTLPILETDLPTTEVALASALYTNSILLEEEKEIKDELTATLKAMNRSLNLIKEYEQRVENEGVIVPTRPDAINGDVIVNADTVPSFVFGKSFTKGHTTLDNLDIDWQNKSLATGGYFDNVLPANISEAEYFTIKAEREEMLKYNSSDTEWLLVTNNKSYETLDNGTSAGNNEFLSKDKAIKQLVDEYNTYISLKQKYQIDLLGELLTLNATSDFIETRVNVKSDLLTVITAGTDAGVVDNDIEIKEDDTEEGVETNE